MKLVEAEAEGPIEGEEAIVTPPRPPHRRVSVSIVLTLTVLIGTVVAIYVIFPARHNALLTEAIDQHRDEQQWDITAPSLPELRAWALGVVGKGVPLPEIPDMRIVGAREIEVLDRRAALVRFAIGADEITYVVQHSRGMIPKGSERTDGDVHAISWRSGKFSCIAVGPDATRDGWIAAVTKKK
jgi:hypothetical protein